MASENKQIEQVVKAAKNEERLTLREKAEKLRVKALEKGKRTAERALREAREAPNITQLAIGTGAGLAAGMGGFKAQKYLAGTAMGQAVDAETGDPTFTAKLVRTGLPVGAGLGLAIVGAFIPNGGIAAAVMGGGTGFAGGALTSAFLDD